MDWPTMKDTQILYTRVVCEENGLRINNRYAIVMQELFSNYDMLFG